MALIISSAYPGKTTPPSSQYPQGSAQNVTVPGDDTGTPWEQLLLDDLLGFQQQLIYSAGITPSGSPDEVGASQYFEAMQKCAGFPGTFILLGLNDIDPSVFGVRILVLNGAGIDIVDYPALIATTYVGDSANAAVGGKKAGFYKSSDESGDTPDIAGPYYILPNAYGKFLRCVDNGEGIDPDGERYIGEDQLDSGISHAHSVVDGEDEPVGYTTKDLSSISSGTDKLIISGDFGFPSDVYAMPRYDLGGDNGESAQWISETSETEKVVEEESRPRNITCNLGVWY